METIFRAPRMRRRDVLVGLVASLAVAACARTGNAASAGPAPPMTMTMPMDTPSANDPTPVPVTPVATNAVSIDNFAFSPASIAVSVGTTVTWTNFDVEQHTVTERGHAWDSDAIANGKSFSHRFDQAGEYHYFCQIHPNMTGVVVVK